MKIEKEEVVFDQFGQWSHSAIHALGEEFDEMPFKDIHHFSDFDMMPILITDDDDLAILCEDEDRPADFRKWQPDPPKGEGWFPFCFSEGEDGPYVLYVRPKNQISRERDAVNREAMIERAYEWLEANTGFQRATEPEGNIPVSVLNRRMRMRAKMLADFALTQLVAVEADTLPPELRAFADAVDNDLEARGELDDYIPGQ